MEPADALNVSRVAALLAGIPDSVTAVTINRVCISRKKMDGVALKSQKNAERANQDGSFKNEIVPIEIPRRKKDPLIFSHDEHFRPGLTMADLEKLPPAFVPKIG